MAAWTSSNTPALEHDHLATAPLLGRGPEHPHGQAECIGERCEPEARPDRRGGDDVVAAGVADLRERVVLGADGEHEGALADLGAERGGHASGAGGHREPGTGECLARQGRRADLLEGGLGVVVDLMAEPDEVREGGFHRVLGDLFALGHPRIRPSATR